MIDAQENARQASLLWGLVRAMFLPLQSGLVRVLAADPKHVVAARLGHADPSVALRVYAHVIRDQVAEAADIFARSIQADDMAAVSKSASKKPAAGRATGR